MEICHRTSGDIEDQLIFSFVSLICRLRFDGRSDVLGFSPLARSLDLFSRTSSSLTVKMASMAAGDD
ncbi:unnamed protein product [Prunus armeniaca]|uniref:Uncharacterized protein n=1 Tax=Prunus armeniaca TaxID=36596 RepID=A0A6J5VEN9_PRUAR|nr:unnamed protein product [Prunus armeniaca]CAB4317060.1 unnamed protein product [Prunus armeniaca]